MADVTLPNNAIPVRTTLKLDIPQINHTSAYTGSITSINRSTGIWRGSMAFGLDYNTVKDVQAMLDELMLSAKTFDFPLNSLTLPSLLEYNNERNIEDLRLRGFASKADFADSGFPYFTDEVIKTGMVIDTLSAEFRSAAALSISTADVSTTDYLYLSTWAWCDYQPHSVANNVPSNQVFLGVIFYDDDDNALVSTSNLYGFDGRSGPVYYNTFTTKPGWREYGITIGTGLGHTIHPNATKVRLYLAFIDYVGGVDTSTEQGMQFANLGIWKMPFISATTGSTGTYTLSEDIDLPEPIYCKIVTEFNERLVRIRKIGDRLVSVSPFVLPRVRPAAFYLKPTWSMESRLSAPPTGVTRTGEINQETGIDFVEAI